jgi:hypothetical protein
MKLAQASACVYRQTSVRWSQTDRFGLQKMISTITENKWRRFKQKTAKTPLFAKMRLGIVSSFASFARDQRTLVEIKASRRGVTPVSPTAFWANNA